MPVVVTPEIDACAEMWYSPEELALELEISVPQAEEAIVYATHALWDMTGRQFHGYQCWVEEYKIIPGQKVLRLDKSPVNQVFSVEQFHPCSGDAAPLEENCYLGDGQICLPRSCVVFNRICGCTNPYIRVEYQTKPNLPIGADSMARLVANEFVSLSSGGACALPDRITSVTRQGVSWSLADVNQYLERSITGIDSVDVWLARIIKQGFLRARNTLVSGILVSSELAGCGEDCTEVGS